MNRPDLSSVFEQLDVLPNIPIDEIIEQLRYRVKTAEVDSAYLARKIARLDMTGTKEDEVNTVKESIKLVEIGVLAAVVPLVFLQEELKKLQS